MPVTKNLLSELVPAQPRVDEIPYRAAYTVCGQTPAQGEWRTQTSFVRMQAKSGESVQYPPNTQSVSIDVDDRGTPSEADDIVYYTFTISTTVWVQTAPPGPVVCVTYPEQPFVPGQPYVPPHYVYTSDLGWNAGANSIDSFDGDVELAFDGIERVVGLILGLTTTPEDVPTRERIEYGFYFQQSAGGAMRWMIYEGGAIRTSPQPYSTTDTWRITRVGGTVRYYRNDVRVHISSTPSSGVLSAANALYASGDTSP